MQAAEHGADFPMAQKVRASMSHSQLHDFAVGSEAGKPAHVKKPPKASAQHPHKNLGAYLHPKGAPAPKAAQKAPKAKAARDTVGHAYDFRKQG